MHKSYVYMWIITNIVRGYFFFYKVNTYNIVNYRLIGIEHIPFNKRREKLNNFKLNYCEINISDMATSFLMIYVDRDIILGMDKYRYNTIKWLIFITSKRTKKLCKVLLLYFCNKINSIWVDILKYHTFP